MSLKLAVQHGRTVITVCELRFLTFSFTFLYDLRFREFIGCYDLQISLKNLKTFEIYIVLMLIFHQVNGQATDI